MGGKGSGRKKGPSAQLRDAIDSINVPEIVKRLSEWARGKEVICPHCGAHTGCYTADTVALQSAVELMNRRLGKPVQRHDVDITESIVLSADQIDTLIERYQIVQRALLPAIEGEYVQRQDEAEGKYQG